MSYFGSIVLARADELLPRLDGITAIGFLHRRLRELGDGWQILETHGWDDPPVMTEAVTAFCERWDAPVLAAYVSDSCAQVHGVLPGAPVWSGHLLDAVDDECGYLHRPPVAAGGSRERLVGDLAAWASGAGLPVSAAKLDRALDPDGDWMFTQNRVFELIRAFGFASIPAPREYEFDPDDEPFAGVVGGWAGLAFRARTNDAHRRLAGEPAAWEAPAIQLELDVYGSLYGGPHTPEELALRAVEVARAYEASERPPLEREIVIDGTVVQNTAALIEEIAPKLIRDRLIVHRARLGERRPNGTGFWGDDFEGEGRWPCHTGRAN